MLLNIWGTLASIAIIVSYIPQLKQTYTTKNVEGQNLLFWILLSFSVAYFFINSILTKAGIVTVVAQALNLSGALGMMTMVGIYKEDK